MQKQLKAILFVVLFVILWLPFLQELTRFFKEKELKGAYNKPVTPVLSIASFKSIEFQKQFEDYKNNNFGFRPLLVKIKNSIDYILFKELSVTDNVAGKDEFIFSKSSIERTLGIAYNGKEKNDQTLSKINFMREGLENKGKKLLIVIAPSKESVIPEYLPGQYRNIQKDHTDYKDLLEGLKKYNVPVVDFCAYFKQIKDTSSYPLFTKTGFHWSAYSSSLAHDHLLKRVEDILQKPMPSYQRKGVEFSDTARESDADFEDPLNLLFKLGQEKYVYPKLQMVTSSLKNFRPKVIIIGDSFFWQIKNQRTLMNIFSDDSKYWYYFGTTSFPINDGPGIPLKDINVMAEIESADLVILLGSLGTTDRFPFGISDYYYDNNSNIKIVDALKNCMAWNIEWNTSIKEEAILNSLSLDQLMVDKAKRIARDKKTFKLVAYNNKYVCADGGRYDIVIADKINGSTWETFSMLKLNNRAVAIYSYTDRFLSAELNGKSEITANRDKIGLWETFTMTEVDHGFVAFKACNGKYLSVDKQSLQLIARSNSIGENEKFKIIYL